MGSQGSNDDCYFYFYSSCTKGDDCPFRHCQAALGTEIVCSSWREGRCFRDNCKFRHMESRINRSSIQCYWEDQPSGCLKPHCVFMHLKPRFNNRVSPGNEGLILPVSSTSPQTSPSAKVTETKDTVKSSPCVPVESYSSNIDDTELTPTSIPITPVVVSFDNEESDSESASSTPMKTVSYDTKNSSVLAKRNLLDSLSDRNDNLGIKTLEQIKMEKIHKESDNFYKSAYDAPLIDPLQIKMKADVYKPEIYPPKSDFIAISDRPVENPVVANSDSNQLSPENERCFKTRPLKRKSIPIYSEKFQPPKKVVSLRKSKEEDPLDFKIKTLDEIRKEKLNKSSNEETSAELKNSSNTPSASDTVNNSEPLGATGKSFKRLKIKRQSKELFSNSSIVQEADSSSDNQKKERTQMILHEVQNISEDQNKADIKGKRKETEANSEERSPKQQKLNSSNQITSAVQSEERQIRISRPIIKRKRSTSILLQPDTSISPPKEEVSSTDIKMSHPLPKENGSVHQETICDNMAECDKQPKTSVEEIDNFLLNEADISLDYEPDGAVNESDDILLEIEQLLDS